MICGGKLCGRCNAYIGPEVTGEERLCAACTASDEGAARCQRCAATLDGDDQTSTAPWCRACESANLVTVELLVTKIVDVWQVEFWNGSRTERVGLTRNFSRTGQLFTLVTRTYDPVPALDRLAYVIYMTKKGAVDVRLTREQLLRLQNYKPKR